MSFWKEEEFWNKTYRETQPLQSPSKQSCWQSVILTVESHLFCQAGQDTEAGGEPRIICRWAQPQTLMQSKDWVLSRLSQGMVLAWLVEPRDPPRVTQELNAWQPKSLLLVLHPLLFILQPQTTSVTSLGTAVPNPKIGMSGCHLASLSGL